MRISKVTTKTGDEGQTRLGRGESVSKSHPRIECLGMIDELSAHIGSAVTVCDQEDIVEDLQAIQQDLFDLGGELAIPEDTPELLTPDRIDWLDTRISEGTNTLPPLKEFVLPGGTDSAGRIHVSRTVCRRVERAVIGLLDKQKIKPVWIGYLNRLSDYLFVAARLINQRSNTSESQWKR